MIGAVHFAVPFVAVVSTEQAKNYLKIAREAEYSHELAIDTLSAAISEVIDNKR